MSASGSRPTARPTATAKCSARAPCPACPSAIDRDDNLYVATPGTRIFGGKLYYNDLTGTLMKFRPGRRQ